MKPAPRLSDWQERLFRWADEKRREPGAWGSADCLTTAASAIEAITGRHPCPELVGKYRSEAGAARVLRREGGFEAAVTRRLGPPLASVLMAHAGDVAVMAEDGLDRLGVVMGAVVAFRSGSGLTNRPLSRCHVAWAVGR